MAKQPWSREQWSKRIGMRIRGTYNPANWLLYALSFVFPRRRNLWVFGTAEDGFFDNSIYFFQYVSRTRTDIEAVWISNRDDLIRRLRERGFRVEKRRSFRGLWACLRAKYYFINHYLPDIHFFASGGATLVNFWHGVPLKKIEFDIDTGPRAHLWQAPSWRNRWLDRPDLYRRPDFVASPARYVSEYAFQRAFRVKLSQCLNLGYPRLDALFESFEQLLVRTLNRGDWRLAQLLHRLKGRRFVLYMPTWRDTGRDYLVDSGLAGSDLEAFCEENDVFFVIKLHPTASLSSWEKDSRADSRVVFIREKLDPYPLLAMADVLVTDYSSTLFDFMLTGRPIVLFPFDLEEYLSQCQSMYFDYREVMWGPVARSSDALLASLRDVLAGRVGRGYTDADIGRFHDQRDGNACERYAEYFAGPPPKVTKPPETSGLSGTPVSTETDAALKSGQPFWSVMIPVGACAELLRDTLASVLNQDAGDGRMAIEVVANEACGDEIKVIVDEVGRGRVRVHFIQGMVGRAQGWNACIERARGKWVHILPAGDMVLPGFYGAYEEVIRRSPEALTVWGPTVYQDGHGQWCGMTEAHSTVGGVPFDAGAHLALRNPVKLAGTVVAREGYRAIGYYAEEFDSIADWDLWMRLAQAGPVGWLDCPFTLSRVEERSELAIAEIGRYIQKQENQPGEQGGAHRKGIRRIAVGHLQNVVGGDITNLLDGGYYRLAMRVAWACVRALGVRAGLGHGVRVVARRIIDGLRL
jgi:CDP-glycerol glycerophosphotransferase (TagB/SpsB family)